MRKNKSSDILINFIIQNQTKFKNSCFFSVSNKNQVELLNFLWKNKIIYGYIFRNQKNVLIYIKNRLYNKPVEYNKINKYINNKNLKKCQIWFKNNFFIINVNKKWFTANQLKTIGIGGYIKYKLS